MLHAEGGWPKDVNPEDEKQTKLYRQRTQRDDAYVHVMQNLCQQMEHAVMQNAVFDIYKTSLENFECTGHRADLTMTNTFVGRPSTPSRVSFKQKSSFEKNQPV